MAATTAQAWPWLEEPSEKLPTLPGGCDPRIEEEDGSMLWTRAQAQVAKESEDHSLSLPADMPG